MGTEIDYFPYGKPVSPVPFMEKNIIFPFVVGI
jgi:hypothetical protein